MTRATSRRPGAGPDGSWQRGDVRLPGPGRLELRPEGDQHQYRQLPYALDHQAQELERRRIDPVHVLVQRQYRLLRRQACELVDQSLQGPPLRTSGSVSAPDSAPVGTPSSAASRGTTSSSRSPARASTASSLASCSSGGASRSNRAARSSSPITG